ncbi:MAG: hypothetical protein KDA25_00705 [Phycisphaerales bacterium]|nr:hypothetical protein [Phycisphaerales bacterium]
MSEPISDIQLLQYAAGETTDDDDRIGAWIATHADAAALVARYRDVADLVADGLDDAPPAAVLEAKAIFDPSRLPRPTRWWETLQQVVADILFDSRARPALAGIRSVGVAFQMTCQIPDVEIDLQFEPDAEGMVDDVASRWTMLGQIAMPDRRDAAGRGSDDQDMVSWAITDADGVVVVDGRTDERGTFAATLAPGVYTLHLALGDRSVRQEIAIP